MVPLISEKIGGVSIGSLAQKYGTPTYVYDAAIMLQRLADLAPWDVVRYAQKANSNLAVVDLLRRHGTLVDTVSEGEIHRALAAGYQPGGEPPSIVYTADIFPPQVLDRVVELGIHVNCGSPDMIDQLGERAPGSQITLRLNPGFGHGHSQKTNTGGPQSKHGIWHEQLEECLVRADHHGMAVTGLHMHIGSGTDMEHLSEVCDAMEKAVLAVGRTVKSISAGGGLPVPYREDEEFVDLDAYFGLWDGVRNRLAEKLGHALSLEIEPGRYLTAESGYLISEVRAVKQMGENLFYLVDAGFNDLARPILYGAYHPMSISPADGDSKRSLREVVVGGPLCESGDIFTQEEGGYVHARKLPAAQVGDYLVIHNAGAYGFVMASNYNSRPMAAEVLIAEGKPHLVRERQTFEDLTRGERVLGECD